MELLVAVPVLDDEPEALLEEEDELPLEEEDEPLWEDVVAVANVEVIVLPRLLVVVRTFPPAPPASVPFVPEVPLVLLPVAVAPPVVVV